MCNLQQRWGGTGRRGFHIPPPLMPLPKNHTSLRWREGVFVDRFHSKLTLFHAFATRRARLFPSARVVTILLKLLELGNPDTIESQSGLSWVPRQPASSPSRTIHSCWRVPAEVKRDKR